MMRGFREWFLLTEVRHASFPEPIRLRITQPGPHGWETKEVDCPNIDMKFEFYTNPIQWMNKGWLQEFPEEVRTRPGQVLINEGYSKDEEMYPLTIPPRQLAQILSEGHAYVDFHSHRIVDRNHQTDTVKVLMINPLPTAIDPRQIKHGLMGLRDGWEEKRTLSWFDFAAIISEGNDYIKYSCHLDPADLIEKMDKLGAA